MIDDITPHEFVRLDELCYEWREKSKEKTESGKEMLKDSNTPYDSSENAYSLIYEGRAYRNCADDLEYLLQKFMREREE